MILAEFIPEVFQKHSPKLFRFSAISSRVFLEIFSELLQHFPGLLTEFFPEVPAGISSTVSLRTSLRFFLEISSEVLLRNFVEVPSGISLVVSSSISVDFPRGVSLWDSEFHSVFLPQFLPEFLAGFHPKFLPGFLEQYS